MPKYLVELSDGRKFQVEADGQPSADDVLSRVGDGNVDLQSQPKVKNADGSTSTVDSRSFNFDGNEVLLPSVTPDGRHLKTDDEVIAEYKKTGRHLGKFKTVEEANAYAKRLHEDYAAGKYDVAPEKSPALKYAGPFSSVVPKVTQSKVVGSILGHEVPVPPEAEKPPSLVEGIKASVANPGTYAKAVGQTAVGLTGIPSIIDMLKTAVTSAPDIASGLIHHPVETMRGGVAGTAEGLMDQATPFNALLLLAGLRSRIKAGADGGGGGAGAPGAVDRYAPNVSGYEPLPEQTVYGADANNRVTVSKQRIPNVSGRVGEVRPSGPPVVPTQGVMNELPLHEQMNHLPTEGPVPEGGRAQTPTPGRALNPNDTPLYKQMEQMAPPPSAPDAPPAPIAPRSEMGKAAADIANRRVQNTGAPKGMTERRQADLLAKYGGNGALDLQAEVANKPIADALTNGKHVEEAFAEMMSSKGAVIDKAVDTAANAGNLTDAAELIENHVKLTTTELAQAMRARFGSQRAGDMLFGNSKDGNVIGRAERQAAIRRMAPGPSRTPQIVEEAFADKDFIRNAAKQKGEINPKLAATLGGGVVGAAVGGTQGDTTEEHVTNAIVGGGFGALAVPLLAHAYAQSASPKLQNYVYGSVLSSPQSIIKAYLGGAGGAIAAGLEKIAGGQVREGSAILQSLFSPRHVGEIVQGFRHPRVSGRAGESPSFVGKIFDAVNEPAVRAMERGGVSKEDAIRYTLSGIPTTKLGQDVLGLWSRHFTLRLATSLFPRVGIQVVERGLERSPLGLMKPSLQTGGTRGTQVARAVAGPAAAVGAYAANDQVPEWAKPFLVALSGVYALPVASGMAVAEAKHKGGMAAVQSVGDTVAKNLPFPQYGPSEALRPDTIASMTVPNLVRDIARARDPQERDTRGQTLGRTRAKIPGLREQLPVKGKNVNIAGQPTDPNTTALGRFFTPSTPKPAPRQGIDERVTSELDRLGIQINAPSFEKTITVGKRKLSIPPDASARAQADRRASLIPLIEKQLDSPGYQGASDDVKKRRLTAIIRAAESAGAQKARANTLRVLRSQGTLRAR